MKFLVLLGIGVLLIGRGIYVTISINSGSDKFKGQGTAARILMYIGVLCVAIAPAWFLFFNEPEEKKVENVSPKITWSLTESSVKNIDTQKLKELLVAFQIACKGWTKYPEAIETAEITVRKFEKSKYESYKQEELGWYTEVELSIKIKNDAKLPTDLRMVPGHTLHYFIGGGKKPGLIMIKDVTALFFGVPASQINTDGHTFVNNEAFKIADELVKEG